MLFDSLSFKYIIMEKLVFVLIPGSFSPPAIYDKVLPHLKKAGYEADALSLPSLESKPKAQLQWRMTLYLSTLQFPILSKAARKSSS
jgi:hypothetical protein